MEVELIERMMTVLLQQLSLTSDFVRIAGSYLHQVLGYQGRDQYEDLRAKVPLSDRMDCPSYHVLGSLITKGEEIPSETLEVWVALLERQVSRYDPAMNLTGKFGFVVRAMKEAGWYRNRFNGRSYIGDRQLTETDSSDLIINLSSRGRNVSPSIVRLAMESSYIENRDPVLDVLTKPPLPSTVDYVHEIFECLFLEKDADKGLLEQLFRRFLFQLVAAAIGVGTLRLVPVLIGPSSIGKSTYWRDLLPPVLRVDYYAESALDQGKDSKILMSERWLINCDEFGGLAKDRVEDFKYFTSAIKFTERRAYGMFNQNYHRKAVLCGTSNSREVINDTTTNNTRIIPIPIVRIDWERLNSIDRYALFAQLYREFQKLGPNCIVATTDELAKLEKWSEQFLVIKADVESVKDHVIPGSNFHSTIDIQKHLESRGLGMTTKAVSESLSKMGCASRRQRVNGGNNPVRGWMVKLL